MVCSDLEDRPYVEVPPRCSGRLSQTDKLLKEIDALDTEVLRLTKQVEALAAELKVAQETLVQIEWEGKEGGELGKDDVGNVFHCAGKKRPGRAGPSRGSSARRHTTKSVITPSTS